MTTQYAMPAQSLALAISNPENKQLKGAPFTVRSKRSGADFTYKFKQAVFNDQPYLHVYIEVEYLKFRYLGWYRDGNLVRKGATIDTPAAKGIAWILSKLKAQAFDAVEAQADLFHMGSCAKCGKPLTDATSIEIGIGPICRSY